MAKKDSLFGKLAGALVTREEEEAPPQFTDEELAAMASSPPVPVVEVDSSQIQATDVLRSIYAQGNFRDETSLFRLDGFIGALPKEMPTETKQSSIGGILQYSGIDIHELIDDGQRRLALLLAAADQLKADNAQREATTKGEIEELKKAIEEAERRISDDRRTTEASCDAIDTEVGQVRALLEFADGVVGKKN